MFGKCSPHSNSSLHNTRALGPDLELNPPPSLNAIMASAIVPASQLEEKPTILIIQDRFQTPAIYKDLADRLLSLGYPTVHPLLPTCSDAQHPNFPSLTLLDDATAVQAELVRLVEHEQKTVMVVMHGYGGMVGSEAVLETMSYSRRREHGLLGGVIHLFFVCVSLVGPGQSMQGGLDSSSNHKVEVNEYPIPSDANSADIPSLPFISPMAAIRSQTAHSSYTTTSHAPKPFRGNHALSHIHT